MDAKKRIAVPSNWLQKDEGEVFHVIPHSSREFLMVMPPEEFNSWEERIMASNAPAPQKRMAIRQFYSEARTVSTDKQGRILLADAHCERTGLSGEAVLMGTGSRIEIWSRDKYAAVAPAHTAAYEQVADIIGL